MILARMPEEHLASATTRPAREWWMSAGVLVGLVIFRSVVLVFWPQAQFDSDQAITGLMAKHLSELRAFPVFYYGQNYMLAVEAWLTAPVFLLAGVSVTTLRLPLLAINIAIALMLLRVLVRETGLRPAAAIVPTLFFALAAPGTAAHMLLANGGTVEPLAWVLLMWMTRDRPRLSGFLFAIGFLQREFALYGLLALVIIEACQGTLFTRDGFYRRLAMMRTAAVVWLTVQWIKSFSSAAGPGTTIADVYQPHDNVVELVSRICLDLRTLPVGAWRILTVHWPVVFGTSWQPVLDFGVDTTAPQGMPGGSIVLAAVLLIPLIVIAHRLATERRWRREYDFCAYLILTALLSCAGYVVGRCGEIGFMLMRYELLSVLGAVGLGAWFLRVEPARWTRRVWIALVGATVAMSAVSHVRILAQYVTDPPVSAKHQIARHLEARGVRYAIASYWIAYSVGFLVNERVVIASEDFVRIREYNRVVDEHRAEAIRIARHGCPGGRQILRDVHFCPP